MVETSTNSTPLFCPLCEFGMTSWEDEFSWGSWGCCRACEVRWSGSKEWYAKTWTKPEETSSEWQEYLQERQDRHAAKAMVLT